MRKLSLFSGIGGIDLAAHWAGMETVAFCERESFPVKVLQKNFPGVPIYDDVCTLTADQLKEDGIIGDGRAIDIISAGYPCQPFSNAGKRRGKEDDRHLWPEVARILQEVRPRWFLGENVAGHITLGLDEVLADLEGLGYTAQPFVIPASAVYAGHRRDRVFIVAYTESQSEGRLPIGERAENTRSACGCKDVADAESWRRHTRRTQQQGQQRELCSVWCCSSCTNKDVANTTCKRCGETRGDQCRRSKEWTSGRSENVADSTSIGRQRPRKFIESSNSTESGEGQTSQSVDVRIQTERATQSGMGRSINELPNGLDRRGLSTLDGLIDLIRTYPQPALMGMPQHDWEPARVATGVKDRTGRLKALGNAVDPLQIVPIMAAIKAINDQL